MNDDRAIYRVVGWVGGGSGSVRRRGRAILQGDFRGAAGVLGAHQCSAPVARIHFRLQAVHGAHVHSHRGEADGARPGESTPRAPFRCGRVGLEARLVSQGVRLICLGL
jgi:hypothetical protein